MPYVWGGSSPDTGFDCSGYVCWVYNQNGYDVGRTTANGLWNKCQHISEAEAAEVNEMVRSARVTPEQLAALLRQSATTTPTPAALSAVGATFNNKEDSNDEDDE